MNLVVFDVLTIVKSNGLDLGIGKRDALDYKVEAAKGQSHCDHIRVDFIAYLPLFYQAFVVIYENGAIRLLNLSFSVFNVLARRGMVWTCI